MPKIRMSIPISKDNYSQTGIIPCSDPATRESLGTIPVDSPEDVTAAVQRAHEAQAKWRQTSLSERVTVLRKLLEFTVQNKDAICLTVQRDSGKTRKTHS